MAISIVNAVIRTSTTGTLALNFAGLGMLAGDVKLALIGLDEAEHATTISGWTKLFEVTTGSGTTKRTVLAFAQFATGSSDTVNWSAANDAAALCAVIRGVTDLSQIQWNATPGTTTASISSNSAGESVAFWIGVAAAIPSAAANATTLGWASAGTSDPGDVAIRAYAFAPTTNPKTYSIGASTGAQLTAMAVLTELVTTPTYTGTADLTAPAPTLAADGTETPPTFSGSASLVGPLPTLAAIGTETAPTFSGSAALAGPKPLLGAAGTFTGLNPTGQGDLQGPKPSVAAAGSFTKPTFSGSSAISAPKPTLAATGQHVSATSDLQAPKPTVAASGTFSINSSTADLSAPKPVVSSVGSFTKVSFGTAGLLGPKPTLGALGSFSRPVFTGVADLTGIPPTFAGVGVYTPVDAILVPPTLEIEDILYGDRVTSYRWEVLEHPRTRRNLAWNPWPVDGGATGDWNARWGFVAANILNEMRFTAQGSQDSSSRGWDIRGNLDIAPGTDSLWSSIPMTQDDQIAVGVRVKPSKAMTFTVSARLHDGQGNWLGAQVAGTSVAIGAGAWQRVTLGFTAPQDGFVVFSVRANGGVALVNGDTISGQQLLIEPGVLEPGEYFDGGSSPNEGTSYDGASNASTSQKIPVADTLLGTLDGVSDGSLRWTQNAQVKGTGKAKVIDLAAASSGMLRIGDLKMESVRVRPVQIIEGLPENPLGVFLVTNAGEGWEDTGRVWSLELIDKCTVPAQDKVDGSYSVAAGTLILRQVKTILASAGEHLVVNEASTLTTSSGMAWEAGTSKLKIINDLLDVAGYNALWMDGYGNFRTTPRVLPADRSLTYDLLGVPRELRDGELGIYQPDWTRDRDSFEVPNKVIAVQAAGGEDVAALIGQWTNTDPNSPYSYPTRGRWITHTLDSVETPEGTEPEVLAFLRARARATLVQMSAVQAVVKITHLPIPARVTDVVRFSHTQAGVDSRHVLTSIDLDLSALGLMKSTLQEVITL